MTDLSFLMKVKRIDAAVLFGFIEERLASLSFNGIVVGESFEKLAVELNESGIETSRGGRWSARVVRTNFERLEEIGAVERTKTVGACFSIAIVHPATTPQKESLEESDPVESKPVESPTTRSTKSDRKKSTLSKSPQSKTEPKTVTETVTEMGTIFGDDVESASKDGFNIEKRESEETNRAHDSTEPETESSRARAHAYIDYINNITNKQTKFKNLIPINEAIAQVDFTNEKVQRLRLLIARDVYEPSVHSDLIDRATAAVVLKYATTKDVQEAIREARDVQTLYKTTNGFKGERRLWRTFCKHVMNWYETHGVSWTATSSRCEPFPKQTLRVVGV